MKLLDLIEKCVTDYVVLSNEDYGFDIGLLTVEQDVNIFVWLGEDGQPVRDSCSRSGYLDVILSPKLMKDRGWYVSNNDKQAALSFELNEFVQKNQSIYSLNIPDTASFIGSNRIELMDILNKHKVGGEVPSPTFVPDVKPVKQPEESSVERLERIMQDISDRTVPLDHTRGE